MGARLLAKRDDALPFGFGGNKVRKLTLVAAEAKAQGADTLITCGGLQSNHCRATASAAARLGMRCRLVLNGVAPSAPTGNLTLDYLLGAEVTYVGSREERAPAMERIADEIRASGGVPFVIPLGASTPLGAMGLARGIGEMVAQGIVPDIIVSSTSSGGTQAGLVAGCALYGVRTRVIGISADDPVPEIRGKVLGIVAGVEERLGLAAGSLGAAERFEADAGFVGEGYGSPTDASREAQSLAARTEAIVTDHWYTAKALAGLIARARAGEFRDGMTVLFWHTGGQVGVFA
jgi:1-aminocyclopropane-1-carboxylate deaminase/D-cysteine desulfhydrase-like pyridoxal-dependent ACC family enzyme